MTSPALQTYVEAFETLNPQTLHTRLAPMLHEQIHFKDPFNDVFGKTASLQIFEHMFATLDQPRFKVRQAAMSDTHTALLRWQFHFNRRNQLTSHCIEGMSCVRFNAQGQVIEHIDHWDAAEQVYAKVPLLGWGIKWIRRRLSAPHSVSQRQPAKSTRKGD
ncbi:nuclear transport factor 2 family protein [Thiomicrorhabdus cannonii]|uniref:nuclear transport factor 2 family protein n=1 Tax=Thiomicrorhabdus cannonii TaxID=2748011 RepID=UPI0015BFD8A1|nr:nuclear transport factor 2 family protein [Thiomicrorhabdus cannonii]